MTVTDIAFWTLVSAVIGVVIAGAGVFYAIKSLRAGAESLQLAAQAQKESTEVARAQFWVLVRAVLANYDDVHANLRPPEEDEEYASRGPLDAAGWARVELYMGMFEYCEKLIDRGLLRQEDFGASYRYRLENLVRNAVIVKEKLHAHKSDWKDFYRLCERLQVDIPSREELARSARF